jgi:hypothetical protein
MKLKAFLYHRMLFKLLEPVLENDADVSEAVRKTIKEYRIWHSTDYPIYLYHWITTTCPIDRTGQFNIINSEFAPIPDFDSNFSMSFDDCCFDAGQQIWKKFDEVDLLWSGGIDSTLAALALIETQSAGKKLNLFCTESSREEFPWFWERHNNLLKVVTTEEFLNIKYLTPAIPQVTGHPALFTQVGGSNMNIETKEFIHGTQNALLENNHNIGKDVPWYDFMRFKNRLFSRWLLEAFEGEYGQKYKDQCMKYITKLKESAPFELKTFYDLNWWLLFSQRINWGAHTINLRRIIDSDTAPHKIDLDKHIDFFLTDNFQKWSMFQHSRTDREDTQSYKINSKKFILKYTKHAEYFENKSKENSMLHIKTKRETFSTMRRTDLPYNGVYLITNDGNIWGRERHIPGKLLNSLFN